MIKYEYQSINIGSGYGTVDPIQTLNTYGAEGWQVVSFSHHQYDGDSLSRRDTYSAILMRPILGSTGDPQ